MLLIRKTMNVADVAIKRMMSISESLIFISPFISMRHHNSVNGSLLMFTQNRTVRNWNDRNDIQDFPIERGKRKKKKFENLCSMFFQLS